MPKTLERPTKKVTVRKTSSKKATKKKATKKATAKKTVTKKEAKKPPAKKPKPTIESTETKLQFNGLTLVPSNGRGAELKLEEVAGEVVALNPNEIVSEDRVRQDVGDINDLAASISKFGQIQPITVFVHNGRAVLESGERRRLACIQLKRPVLAVFVDQAESYTRLTRQLHENFRRKDFDDLEASEGLTRQKRLYEAAHPETRVGSTGGSGTAKRTKDDIAESAKSSPAPRFTMVASKEMGVSERRVQELLAIDKLPKKYKKKIEAATTTSERKKVIQECFQQVRQDRKRSDMEAAAAAKRQMSIEDAVEDSKNRPAIVVHYGDNREFMVGSELYEVCCTDPPYDRERNAIQHTTRASVNPEAHDWDKLDVGWVLRAAPMLTKGGHLLVFCPLEYIGAYELAIQQAELDYRGAMVWVKSNPAPVHRDCYASAVEGIVWATKPGAKPWFNPEMAKAGAASWNVFQGPTVPGSAKDRIHPTQKPEWLIQRLLTTHASPELGHRVLDPFAGGGTTGVVCQKLRLACTMIERDEDFIKALKLRLEARR